MISDRRVELCLASHHFFPSHGGSTLRFLRYFPRFRHRGIYTRVVTGTPKTRKLIMTDITREWIRFKTGEILPPEDFQGTLITRIRLPDDSSWRRSIIFNQAVLRFCLQSDYRPDVVQLLSSLPLGTLPWLIRLRNHGLPLVYACTAQPKLPSTPLNRISCALTNRVLYKHLDCIIVQSTVMEDLLLDLGVRTRIEIIPNGVDLQRFHPVTSSDESRALRASLGIGENEKMITTVGALSPGKGSDLLVEAWAELAARFPKVHLVIVGPLFDENHPKRGAFRRKIEELVAASGAADRVHLPGFVEHVEDYLRASELFVFTPLKGGMPNVVLEAMACGVPVILTPFIALPKEFGEPGQEYCLVKRDSNAIAEAIAELLQNEEWRKNLGRRGRSWVEETMDLEQSLDQYADLYHELAEQRRKQFRAQ